MSHRTRKFKSDSALKKVKETGCKATDIRVFKKWLTPVDVQDVLISL